MIGQGRGPAETSRGDRERGLAHAPVRQAGRQQGHIDTVPDEDGRLASEFESVYDSGSDYSEFSSPTRPAGPLVHSLKHAPGTMETARATGQ